MAPKQPPLGSGQRFAKLESKIEREPGYSKPQAAAVAAAIGRKKYGAKHFAALGAKGRK